MTTSPSSSSPTVAPALKPDFTPNSSAPHLGFASVPLDTIRPTQRLASIQILRAIAALLVVLMRTLNMSAFYSGSHAFAAAARGVQHVGHFGIDIFFVISGFVISRLARYGGSGKKPTTLPIWPPPGISCAALASFTSSFFTPQKGGSLTPRNRSFYPGWRGAFLFFLPLALPGFHPIAIGLILGR